MNKIQLINFVDLNMEQKKMILNWRNHPNIREWMYNKDIITLESHLNYIKSLETQKDRVYFLVKDGKNAIGVIDLTSIDSTNKTAEIGLYTNPFLKGYGKILMTQIINYSFNELGLSSLYSNVFITNDAAIHLYKRFNFYENKRENKLVYMELKNENR